jgi:hypothetical protein
LFPTIPLLPGQAWLELHKVPFRERTSFLRQPLYEVLLPLLVKRACWPPDLDDLDEEDWILFREEALGPVIIK